MSEDNSNDNSNEEEPTILEIVAKRQRRWQLEDEAQNAWEGHHVSVLAGTSNNEIAHTNTRLAQLNEEGEALDSITGNNVKDVPRTCRAVDHHKQGHQVEMDKHQHVTFTANDEYPDIIPGAYAEGGIGTDEDNSMIQQHRPPQEQLQNPMPAAENETDGLAVANPVQGQDGPNPIDLPTAQDYDLEASRQRNEKTVAFKRNILLAVIVMIALIVVLVAALVKPDNPSYVIVDDTIHPTSSPSPAPTSMLSFEDHVLSLLPDHSIRDVHSPQSSQFKALQWILDGDTTLPNERIQQRFALATLYHSTAGEKWAKDTNWLNHSVHECTWYNKNTFASKDTLQYVYPGYLANFEPPMSTSCDSNGHYTNLWLDQNNLVGRLPRELYLLTSLQTVSLAMNPGLQGSTITSHIGHLKDLRGLAMFMIMLTGTLPTEIGLLTQLQAFGVNNNLLEGEIPSEIWQLTKLQTLSLNDNLNLHGSIPSAIGALSNLRWLVAEECDLTGTIPTEVGLLSSLEWFALGDNRLTGTLPGELSLLPNLVLLSVHKDSLEGTIPSELGLLTSCTLLSLSANSFTGQIPKELFQLTSLRLMDFGGNLFSPGTLPTEVGRLQLIEKLSFNNVQRIGPIPSELGLLTLLGWLHMRANSFSGTIPEELMALQWSLHTMSVEDNPMLSGTVPNGLCNINGTCIPDSIINCQGNDGLHGSIRFDCTSLLCGCNCATCNDGDS
ncbi:Leucine Rich Repeat [Seminavis robusta]|uniref:Leucine Rich Repeat n=1 Tax=Seminavis robusta TaxID=568900 RepID=A0A9N8HNP4_9STRA|nr:Leucine Rich Repeat [Seminavis robusta]|eukprot:Sro1236_g255140.1 Leucine Rich Repeat (723) ;mRNA; f:19494-21746